MNRAFILGVVALLLGAGGSVMARAGSTPVYTLADLGALSPTGSSFGLAINNSGQATGTAATDHGVMQAFRGVAGGDPFGLGSLSGSLGTSRGMAINSAGQVAGISTTTGGSSHAFVSDGGGNLSDLGTLPGGSWTEATGINERGQVVGVGDSTGGIVRAFIADANGTLTSLGNLGGRYTRATAINDLAQVVGASRTASGALRAFRTDGQKLIDLGTLPGGGDSHATDINNKGQVVGHATSSSGNEIAFISRETGGLQALGTLPGARSSVALGINDDGLVVGRAGYNSTSRAFLWSSTLGMVDLNSLVGSQPDWILLEASGIARGNYIVGTGLYKGQARAFLLSPFTPALVPEPSTLVLLALPGSLGLFLASRRWGRRPR